MPRTTSRYAVPQTLRFFRATRSWQGRLWINGYSATSENSDRKIQCHDRRPRVRHRTLRRSVKKLENPQTGYQGPLYELTDTIQAITKLELYRFSWYPLVNNVLSSFISCKPSCIVYSPLSTIYFTAKWLFWAIATTRRSVYE